MQDPEKLREIDSLGEEFDDSFQEEDWEGPEEKSHWGGALLLQSVICALAMLELVFFRITDDERYQEIAQWYGREMSQEIELPQLQRTVSEPDPTPEPSPSASPLDLDGASQQLL